MNHRLVKVTLDGCLHCNRAIEPSEDGYFVPHCQWAKKSETITRALQTCRACFETSEAIEEAKADRVRFTAIGVFPLGTEAYEGDRCPCGNVSLRRIKGGWCVRCSIDYRMLQRGIAESRFNLRLIRSLKREIRNAEQGRSDAGHIAPGDRASEERPVDTREGEGDGLAGTSGQHVTRCGTESAARGEVSLAGGGTSSIATDREDDCVGTGGNRRGDNSAHDAIAAEAVGVAA